MSCTESHPSNHSDDILFVSLFLEAVGAIFFLRRPLRLHRGPLRTRSDGGAGSNSFSDFPVRWLIRRSPGREQKSLCRSCTLAGCAPDASASTWPRFRHLSQVPLTGLPPTCPPCTCSSVPSMLGHSGGGVKYIPLIAVCSAAAGSICSPVFPDLMTRQSGHTSRQHQMGASGLNPLYYLPTN